MGWREDLKNNGRRTTASGGWRERLASEITDEERRFGIERDSRIAMQNSLFEGQRKKEEERKRKEAYDKTFKGRLDKLKNIKWSDVKSFGKKAFGEARDAVEVTGGMAQDIMERTPLPPMLPMYLKDKYIRSKEAKKYAKERIAKNPRLNYDDEYKAGKIFYDARQLNVEKAMENVKKRKGEDVKDFRLDIAEEGNIVERAKQNWRNPEIRKAILSVPEAVTYFAGVGESAGAAKAILSSSLKKRILARSGAAVGKEAALDAVLQEMKKDAEDRNLKSVGKNFLTTALMMSVAGNILGEGMRTLGKVKKGFSWKKGKSKAVDNTIKEVEKKTEKKLVAKEKTLVADAVTNQKIKPSEIVKNVEHTIEVKPVKNEVAKAFDEINRKKAPIKISKPTAEKKGRYTKSNPDSTYLFNETKGGYEVLTELDISEAGQRSGFYDPSKPAGDDYVNTSTKSTFPRWIPEDLRSKDLFNKVQTHIENGTIPNGSKQKRLYDTLLEEVAKRENTIVPQELPPKPTRKAKQQTLESQAKGKSLDEFVKNNIIHTAIKQKVKLSDIYKNPVLYEKYPELKNVNVRLDSTLARGTSGGSMVGKQDIAISSRNTEKILEKLPKVEKRMREIEKIEESGNLTKELEKEYYSLEKKIDNAKVVGYKIKNPSVLAHEIEHAKQQIEGGGARKKVKELREINKNEVDSRLGMKDEYASSLHEIEATLAEDKIKTKSQLKGIWEEANKDTTGVAKKTPSKKTVTKQKKDTVKRAEKKQRKRTRQVKEWEKNTEKKRKINAEKLKKLYKKNITISDKKDLQKTKSISKNITTTKKRGRDILNKYGIKNKSRLKKNTPNEIVKEFENLKNEIKEYNSFDNKFNRAIKKTEKEKDPYLQKEEGVLRTVFRNADAEAKTLKKATEKAFKLLRKSLDTESVSMNLLIDDILHIKDKLIKNKILKKKELEFLKKYRKIDEDVADAVAKKTNAVAKKTNKKQRKISKVAQSIEDGMKDAGIIGKDAEIKKATFNPKTIKEESKKVAKVIGDEDKLFKIVRREEKLPDNIDPTMFLVGVEKKLMKMKNKEKALELGEFIASKDFAGQTSVHAQGLRFAQERDPESIVASIDRVVSRRRKQLSGSVSAEKRLLKKYIKESPTEWKEFFNSIKCKK